jgi:hypothetical protein
MKWRCRGAAALACGLGLLGGASRALAAELELRVLVVAVGDRAQDPARDALEDLLEALGVPYEVLDSSRQALTSDVLYSSPDHGRFNGILLTDSETYLPFGGLGFDAEEFALLHEYERTLGVREAVLSGYPTADPSLGLDYGMAAVGAGLDTTGRWQNPAGGSEIFEYINTANDFPTEDFTFLGRARQDGFGPSVEPLLVDAENPEDALIARLRYPDGRQVLLGMLNNASFYLHTHVLAYEFLNFATNGLFLGARRAYLAVHNDDLFLADEVWDPATRSNYPDGNNAFRLEASDVEAAVRAQALLHERFPLASTLRIDFAFNGSGAQLTGDALTDAVVANAGEFGFINHTYEALQMDWLCPSADSAEGCLRTDYQSAYLDIQRDAELWQALGLPDADQALRALVSDSHSGLSDRRGTPDVADDIPFPDGLNTAFVAAAAALGVETIASDMSRPNQQVIQRVPGSDQVLLPRYPTALFYNATTPEEIVSEYNYLFHDRYVEQGMDPCSLPAALCMARSYEQILDSEAEVTLRHILSYEPLPHYFHQSNLRVYDAAGHTLQFDWLERVLSAYTRCIDLPLENLRFTELGSEVRRRILTREAAPRGWLDTVTGSVTLTAAREVDVVVTGLAGGETYGGQSLRRVDVSATPRQFERDAALDR